MTLDLDESPSNTVHAAKDALCVVDATVWKAMEVLPAQHWVDAVGAGIGLGFDHGRA